MAGDSLNHVSIIRKQLECTDGDFKAVYSSDDALCDDAKARTQIGIYQLCGGEPASMSPTLLN